MSIGTNEPLAGAGPGPGAYVPIGAGLLGFTANDPRLGSITEDFAASPLAPATFSATLASGGTCADVAGFKGGVSRLATTVAAGSFAKQNTASRLTQSTAVDKWYFAWRFRTPLSVDVNSRLNSGLCNFADTGAICCGVNGDSSLVNYTFRWDGHPTSSTGSLRDTGVAIDTTNFHIAECWHPGDGKYHFRFDGGAELATATPGSPISDTLIFSAAYDAGVGGHADAHDRDWMVTLFGRF